MAGRLRTRKKRSHPVKHRTSHFHLLHPNAHSKHSLGLPEEWVARGVGILVTVSSFFWAIEAHPSAKDLRSFRVQQDISLIQKESAPSPEQNPDAALVLQLTAREGAARDVSSQTVKSQVGKNKFKNSVVFSGETTTNIITSSSFHNTPYFIQNGIELIHF